MPFRIIILVVILASFQMSPGGWLVIDVCARLLVANSSSRFTMHGLAEEASTSIGSISFFAGKHAVIDALIVRHLAAFKAILSTIESIPDSDWMKWSPNEVMQALHSLNIWYVRDNPDVRILWSEDQFNGAAGSGNIFGMLSLYKRVLVLRMPQAAADDIELYAQALYRLPMGFKVGNSAESSNSSAFLFSKEAPRAMTAYLQAIEGIPCVKP